MSSFPAGEYLVALIFLLFLATTVSGALLAVFTARIIRSVCGLALCCLGLAGLFYYLDSPFLALMEILIYVGAVCVTIVFAVMLAEPEEPGAGAAVDGLQGGAPLAAGRDSAGLGDPGATVPADALRRAGQRARRTDRLWGAAALVVGAAVFWGVARLGLLGEWTTPAVRVTDGSVEAIGVSLLTTYSLAFEAISLVLLVAILGALAIARIGRHHE